jgi:leucyl/phenylalanyl-tRNA--protein transferase
VGGLYGVASGALFAAESMFHRRTNASKVALVTTLLVLFDAGVTLFDVQFMTDHLESLGAFEIERGDYLDRLKRATVTNLSLNDLRGQDLLPRALDLLASRAPANRAPAKHALAKYPK